MKKREASGLTLSVEFIGGAEGIRTPDLANASRVKPIYIYLSLSTFVSNYRRLRPLLTEYAFDSIRFQKYKSVTIGMN